MPVFSSDGENLGRVVKVLSAPNLDMFDGVIFDTSAGPGGHRFVDAPEVGEIFENGIVLKIDATEAAQLPKPDANPGAMKVNPAEPRRRQARVLQAQLGSPLRQGLKGLSRATRAFPLG